MARKKKNKIVVDLDLPKDDSTMTKLYAILFISILLGMGTAVMWATNSGFIPTSNGEPMFTNVACGAITGDSKLSMEIRSQPMLKINHVHFFKTVLIL